MNKDLLRRLRGLDIVYKGKFNLKNVKDSYSYVDVKKAYGYPDVLSSICDELWNLISVNGKVASIAAEGYGGLPIATALSLRYDIKLTLVRNHPKNYGKVDLIDGYLPTKEDNVAIVDDVFTTGRSINYINDVLTSTGAKVTGCYVVVKRSHEKLSIPLYHLFTLADLL